MFSRLIATFLILTFFASLEAESLKVDVKAKSAILYNPQNGAILFKKRENEPHFPASITKIATSLFVLDGLRADLEKKCLPSKRALAVIQAKDKHANLLKYPSYILEHDGTMMGVKQGITYTIRDLLHGLIFVSGNDAANVLAEHCAPSIETFMERFNSYLQEKGIKQTHFKNPHGLHHPEQVTTAHDMALISAWAFEHPILSKILSTKTYEIDTKRTLHNLNPLIKESSKFFYPKSIGGKTGYTSSAGKNLVAAAESQGRRLIAVLLGYENREDRFIDAIALFEAAFREKKLSRVLFAKEQECFSRKIEKIKKPLQAGINEDVILEYFPSEEQPLQAKLIWHDVQLPIEKGTIVGKLVVENDKGRVVGECPLFAQSRLKKPFRWLWLWALVGSGILIFGMKNLKNLSIFRK